MLCYAKGYGLMQLNDPKLFRQQAYINGEWVNADEGGTVEVTNPSNGAVLGTIADCGPDETRRAIEAANAAWPAWRARAPKERSDILRRWYELMMENADPEQRGRVMGLYMMNFGLIPLGTVPMAALGALIGIQ